MSAPQRTVALQAAASLTRRQAFEAGNYREACRQNWLDDQVESPQLPIFDPVTQDYVTADDVVLLSDGNCYSKKSIQELLQSGVIDLSTGRARLPLTNLPMTDDDYVLVGASPPSEQSAQAQSSADQRTLDVQIASMDVRRDRRQMLREMEMRYAAFERGDGGQRARPEFAYIAGTRYNFATFSRLLSDLDDDVRRQCAIALFAAGLARNGARVVAAPHASRLARMVALRTNRSLFDFVRAEVRADCAEYAQILTSRSEWLMPLFSVMVHELTGDAFVAPSIVPNVLYVALRVQNESAARVMLERLYALNVDDRIEAISDLLFGAFGRMPAASYRWLCRQLAAATFEQVPSRRQPLYVYFGYVLSDEAQFTREERRTLMLHTWLETLRLWTLRDGATSPFLIDAADFFGSHNAIRPMSVVEFLLSWQNSAARAAPAIARMRAAFARAYDRSTDDETAARRAIEALDRARSNGSAMQMLLQQSGAL